MVMQVLDIGIERSDILPPTIVMTVVFLMTKVLKFIQVMEDLDIGILKPTTLPQVITDLMDVC